MLFLILVIVFVVLSLWLTAVVAKALGAGNPSMLGIIAAGAVAGIIMVPVSLAVTHPALLIAISLVVSVASLAKFLDMNLVGAFLVYLANSLVFGVFVVAALFFGLGLSFDWGNGFSTYNGEVSIAEVERTAEDVCACGRDEDCQIERYFEHAQAYTAFVEDSDDDGALSRAERYTERADECFENPRPYVARTLVETQSIAQARPSGGIESPEIYDGLPELVRPKQAQVKVRKAPAASPEPSYREVPVQELSRYLSHPMRLTRRDQKQFEGLASVMPNGDTRLINRRLGGEFGLVIPQGQLLRVEVLRVWQAAADESAENADVSDESASSGSVSSG